MSIFRRKATSQLTLSAELTQLIESPLTFTPDGTVFSDAFNASYSTIYRQQSAVRAVVDFYARNIAQCKMRVMRRTPDGSLQPEEEHPLQTLLDHPGAMPRSRFMRQIVADKAIYDAACVWKYRENDPVSADPGAGGERTGAIIALVRIPIPFLTIRAGAISQPDVFVVTAATKQFRIPAKDVVWLPGYNTSSNAHGTPPMETLRQILAEEYAAGKDRERFWRNGARLSGWFEQGGEQVLSEEAKKRFKEDWNSKFAGVNGDQVRGTPILPKGLALHETTADAVNSEYLATRTLAREEVCRQFGVQPQILGIGPATFASMDMYHQMLYQDALSPWMVAIQEEFEEQLLYTDDFEGVGSGYALDFNINAKLQGSFLDQAKIGQQAVGGPWMTRNEFREKFQGLPPVAGGDEIIVPLNVVVGGGPQANPQDATNQFNAEVVDLRDVKARQRLRSVLDGLAEGDTP